MNESGNNVYGYVRLCVCVCASMSIDKTEITYLSGFLWKTVTFPLFIISLFYDSHRVVCEFFVEIKDQSNKGTSGEIKVAKRRLASLLSTVPHLGAENSKEEPVMRRTNFYTDSSEMCRITPLAGEAERCWEKGVHCSLSSLLNPTFTYPSFVSQLIPLRNTF